MPVLKKPISKSKEKTTFLLEPRKKAFGNGVIEILEQLFWKNIFLAEPALKFLEKLEKNGELHDSLWKETCKETGLEQGGKIKLGRYRSIIKKLLGSGMIRKDKGYWKLCSNFSEHHEAIANTWRAKFKRI